MTSKLNVNTVLNLLALNICDFSLFLCQKQEMITLCAEVLKMADWLRESNEQTKTLERMNRF